MSEKHDELERAPGAPQIINKHQLAELLDLKVSWIEEQCRRRLIPHLLLAGQYRFTQEHITEILTMHERRPVTEPPKAPPAPTPQHRIRQSRPAPLPGVVAPLRDRGLPTHRLRRPAGAP